MKVSGPQQRALDAMRQDPNGQLRAFNGVTRPTVDALERKGLITLSKQLAERQVRRRSGVINRLAYVDWTARLKPVMPDDAQIAALDALVQARDTATPGPGQHEQAAAYAALLTPQVALAGSPGASPDYSPATAYAQLLRENAQHAVIMFGLVRQMLGALPMPPEPLVPEGQPTDVWLISEPGTPQIAGRELARVIGRTQTDAALTAASVVNRRGGFDMRRLCDLEIGTWCKDFRAGGFVLRLSVTPAGYQVSVVGSDDVMVIRATPEEAERDARADVDSLTSALASRPAIPAVRP